MGIAEKIERKLVCDREGCKTEIVWNPNPGPTEKLPTKLEDVTFVQHAATGYSRVYCSGDCAVLDIDEGKHKPPKPEPEPAVSLASELDVKAVARAEAATKKLRVVR